MSSARFVQRIPWKEVQALVSDLREKGADDAEIRAQVTKLIDDLVPSFLLPPPWGFVAEALDGPVVGMVFNMVRKARQRRAERRAEKETK